MKRLYDRLGWRLLGALCLLPLLGAIGFASTLYGIFTLLDGFYGLDLFSYGVSRCSPTSFEQTVGFVSLFLFYTTYVAASKVCAERGAYTFSALIGGSALGATALAVLGALPALTGIARIVVLTLSIAVGILGNIALVSLSDV